MPVHSCKRGGIHTREWEEAPAFGGAPDGGCVAARDVLNRMAELAVAPRPPGQDGA